MGGVGMAVAVRRVSGRAASEPATIVVMWGWWVDGVGVTFEVAGLLIAGHGIKTTWQANAGESFWSPATDTARAIGSWAYARLPARLRRRPPTVIQVGAAFESSGTLSATGRVNSARLPPDLPVDAALAALDARIHQLEGWYQDGDDRLRTEIRAVRETTEEIGTRVGNVEVGLGETARDLRVEGLRGQAFGLGLLGVGLVLQKVGQLGM